MSKEIDLELDQARTILKILGRNNPSVNAVETVKKLIIWRDNSQEILNGAIEALMFRFDIAENKLQEALWFIDKIKAKKPKPPSKTTMQDLVVQNKDLIMKLYGAGITRANIALYLGIKFTPIRDFIASIGIKKTIDVSFYSPLIKYLLNKGSSIEDIAKEITVDADIIKCHVAVNFTNDNGVFDTKIKIPDYHILKFRMAEILAMKKKGITNRDIAKQMGVHKNAIVNAIYKNKENLL